MIPLGELNDTRNFYDSYFGKKHLFVVSHAKEIADIQCGVIERRKEKNYFRKSLTVDISKISLVKPVVSFVTSSLIMLARRQIAF